MFPNESSSDEFTSKTNAFVQKIKEVQHNNPTDQVPELRDTIDCRADNAMKTAPKPIFPTSPNGCEPRGECRAGGDGGGAGPLLTLPSLSVISSSPLQEPTPPSVTQSSESSVVDLIDGALALPCNVKVSCKSTLGSLTPHYIPEHSYAVASYKARWGIPRSLRLAGGGETATATPGWNNNNTNNGNSGFNNAATGGSGPAPYNNNGNNTSPQQNSTTGLKQPANTTPCSQAAPTSQPATSTQQTTPATSNSQAQQPATSSSQAQNGNAGATWAQAAGKGLPPTSAAATNSVAPASQSTKQQLEQLNNMREALFSQDGWGAHVNQDSGWDIPSSPEPGQKDSTGAPLPPVWKPNVNNGTDLWEQNLRNGGQPPPRVEKTTPWGSHTPASNIGGTWGVDDDCPDNGNMWNPQAQWPGPNQPIWPGGANGPKKEGEWGAGAAAGSNWGDPMRASMDPRDPMARDPRGSIVDQRDPMRGVMDQHRGMVGGDMVMRGDPAMRGISGRLNGGATEGMWGPGPHHMPPAKPWPAGPPPSKDKSNGWEEPSPPQQRRNIPGYDDGTSLWGSGQQRAAAMQAAAGQKNPVSHWKELPPAGMGRGMPPGMPQNRMPNDIKGNNPLWPHPARNGSWEGGHDAAGPWPDEKVGVSWNDPSLLSGPKYKMGGEWDVNPMNPGWDHPPKQPQKPLSKDIVWASKQFRILSEMGFKKEDIETALRNSNMNIEDALELLNMSGNWRRGHSDMEPPFDHSNPPGQFTSQRFNPQQLPFAPPGSSGNGPNSSQLGSMSPAIVQKIMTQQPPPAQTPSQPPATFTQTTRPQQASQPSAHQLRMLVQQIQMAVQTGYLNHQILNQPLAPQTLILLNQLLQHIKVLQNLQMSQQQMLQLQNPLAKQPQNDKALLHNAVHLTKTKQQITNLQNQIQAQQAIYVKQHNQMPPQAGASDFFKANHDPLSALPSTFSELSLNKEPQHSSAFQSQQSRLNQWKLPSLDKDGDMTGSEFSRAPGTTAKPATGNSSPNLPPLLGQADGTWSRSNSEGGWPDSSSVSDDSKEWPNTSQASNQAFTDLVPEFEPGKPWKGTQMKSIEDDPSITPGSVVRSPLSLATIKDTEIFSSGGAGGKTSPTVGVGADTIPPMSLTNNTWSFNPPASTTSSSFTSPLGKLSGSKSAWGEAGPGGDLWAPNKARGPPPGLSSNKGPSTNGWGSLGGGGSRWGPGHNNPGTTWTNQPNSTWLLLKNLTPQIDGSTLKTLCVQHGPLQNFHLYLNHGIALAKYSTRDEASKAQGALNNCVLSNTSIYSEMLAESEVQQLLQHLSAGSGATGGGWGRGGGKATTWGSDWPPASSSLWGGDAPPDPHRSTPSSLNSFLPGDLLGPGDSM
ncbi:protein Gawky-like isoform X2 [Macrosteles quadrilineatus]|uniref:protein Gawky-like isoform X2 n=1 Tax=Macrosteles quadrilineatus TaxID=74068 RepID=UPI0023E1A763|nr:protein Gawky-like isoform X2 [Macrosteles quadrilineatus]